MKRFTMLALCMLLVYAVKPQSSNNLPQLALTPFVQGFDAPMDIANCGDSRLFIAERLGKIWIVDATGNKMAEPFLDITDLVFTVYPNSYDERGLLGLTFHPNYPDSPYLYVNYTGHDSDSHVSRFTLNPNNSNKALRHSKFDIIKVSQPADPIFLNHKAGCIKFGPDGYLYTTFGDGGSANDPLNNAQNPRILLGKMIRLDVDHPDAVSGKHYSIPADNPFVNVPKFKSEIWATGLRNPFRFSFDSKNGALWLPDVGQDLWEEINVVPGGSKGGKNFGWSCYEGFHNFKPDSCDANGTPYTFPIVEYKHPTDNCAAITGGFVYRGNRFKKMQGRYFYNDYCTGKFSTVFKYNDTWLNLFLLESTQYAFTTYGESADKELYVADNLNGIIYHVVDSSDSNASSSPVATGNDIIKSLVVKLYPNPNHGQFNIELTAVANETYRVSITNLFGREIMRDTRNAVKGHNRWSFNATQLPKGIYVLHLQSGRGSASTKFTVE
ncbi:MAG: PQQ-dependent sugar dehydrogenase [Panacibacter sp.]